MKQNVTNYFVDSRKKEIVIAFSTCPSINVRAKLKSNGFRWEPMSRTWHARSSENRISLAKAICC